MVSQSGDIAPHSTKISPDSRMVVFVPAARDRLRVVPIDGPANVGGG